MSELNPYMNGPTVTFWTLAPRWAPDVKGGTRWFSPERLEWQVCGYLDGRIKVRVTAHGPGTRSRGQGNRTWGVEPVDERPSWLLLPIDQLATATLTVQRLIRGESDE